MDLQERKIHFIQEFLKLKSEEIIHKLEDVLKLERMRLSPDISTPYSIDELNKKIDRAEDDAKNGRGQTNQDLQEDIRSWG
ncbi:MAG: hypothetical protein JWO03_115 [Bacteroidetes bacterium]|nr:hypothetical protein [Bacteroidota bacterium]